MIFFIDKFSRAWISFAFWALLFLMLLAGCDNDGGVTTTPGSADSNLQPDPGLNPSVEIVPTYTPPGTITPLPSVTPAAPIESTLSLSVDDFLSIDEILSEIDNDVCQNAYQAQLELEALIAEGVDVAELETAVEELMIELENCPTPTPGS